MRQLGTITNNVGTGSLRRVLEGAPLGSAGQAQYALWYLVASDLATVVEAANYFNPAVTDLKVGDVIIAVVGVGGTMKLKNYVVATNTGTAVTVALQTTTAG